MKTSQIFAYKSLGLSNDAIYRIAAGQLGYFGIAFYGHSLPDPRAQRRAKRILNTIWKRIIETTDPIASFPVGTLASEMNRLNIAQ